MIRVNVLDHYEHYIVTSGGISVNLGGSSMHGRFFLNSLSGSNVVPSKPPKFLLIACSSCGHVGGLPDLSHIQYSILIKLCISDTNGICEVSNIIDYL